MTTEQIYFYSTPSDYEDQIALGKKPMLKIGYTTQETTDERIKQQDTTACAQPLEKKGSYFVDFTDKDFHERLELKGYTRPRRNREFFYITVEDAERELIDYRDGVVKVEKYFKPRPHQAWVNQQILSRFDGESTIIQPLNLCARFGKDLQKLSLFKDSGFEVMVSAGYWLGANESTISTINEGFDITSDIKVIPPDYQQFVDSIGKSRVMIDLSLHTDTDKIDSRLISALSEYTKLIYIDEADFGAWTPPQREKTKLFIDSGINIVCIATGTNIDRAMIGTRGYVVSPITVSYTDLLEAKRGEGYLFQPGGFCDTSDTDREVWMSRLSDIVEVSCVTLEPSDKLITELNSLSDEDRPNMSKIFSKRNAHISRQVIKDLLIDEDTNQDVFGLYETMYRSIDHPAVMMIIPGVIEVANHLCSVGRRLAPHYNWIPLNGDTYTNRTAQKKIQEIIDRGDKERTVIISNGMGSRSFSIPNIISVINCKDGGSIGTANQQASRCFTPGCGKEYGLVVNYSFNTHRTSTFESDLISSVLEYENTDTESDIRRVYGLVNFLTKDEYGYLTLKSEKDFLELISSPENLENMTMAQCDIKGILSQENIDSILERIRKHPSTNKQWKSAIEQAITNIPSNKDRSKGETDTENKKNVDLIKKIYSIIQNTANVYYMSPNSSTFKDGIENISNDTDKSAEYVRLVGISPQVVLDEIYPFLPKTLLDMIILKTRELDSVDYFSSSTSSHSTTFLFDI